MNKKNKTSKKSVDKKNIILMGIIVVVIVFLTVFTNKDKGSDSAIKIAKGTAPVVGGDLTIIKSDVTQEAKFYGYQFNETYMEVIAVRATDGTVRTALNTCQVCNNSGRGYYEQSGDLLICQNCGNPFTINQVEMAKNGCNPIPIEVAMKTEDDEKLVIKEDVLAQYEPLFAVWKKQ